MKFEVKNGGFQYPNGRKVLSGVNFTFEEPGVLSVLGANGAGKTTLMKCMLGLQPWTEGCSCLDGQDIRQMRQKTFWQQVGYVPQARLPSFVYTVREMVVMGRSAHLGELSQPRQKDWDIVEQCLKRVGISHLAGKLCNQISGGEYQLVLIARALATQPQLMVLDEPESNLDFRNQQIVLQVLEQLCREEGISVILNTHYPEHAIDISKKALLLLPDGSTLYGDANEIIREDHLEAAFGIPVRIRTVHLPERDYTCVMAIGPSQHR